MVKLNNNTAFDNIIDDAKSDSIVVKKIIKDTTSKESIEKIENELSKKAIKEDDSTVLFPAPTKKETRSKKLNYLCKPSLHKEFKKKCKSKGVSENEAINQLMQFYIDNK